MQGEKCGEVVSGVWRRLGLVAGLVLLIDQLSKALVLQFFNLGDSVAVIPGLFNLVLVHNYGAAFGIMADLPEGVRQLALAGTTVLALGLLVYLFLVEHRHSLWGQRFIALILGGALGNLIDRVRFGYVVDFLDFYIGAWHWPAFNVADSAICVGVGFILLQGFFKHSAGAPQAEKAGEQEQQRDSAEIVPKD